MLIGPLILVLALARSSSFDSTYKLTASVLFQWCTSQDESLQAACGMFIAGFLEGTANSQVKTDSSLCLPDFFSEKEAQGLFERQMRVVQSTGEATTFTEGRAGVALWVILSHEFPCAKGP